MLRAPSACEVLQPPSANAQRLLPFCKVRPPPNRVVLRPPSCCDLRSPATSSGLRPPPATSSRLQPATCNPPSSFKASSFKHKPLLTLILVASKPLKSCTKVSKRETPRHMDDPSCNSSSQSWSDSEPTCKKGRRATQLKESTLNRNGACNSSSQSWSDSEPTRKKGRRATQLKELALNQNDACNSSSQSWSDNEPTRKKSRRAMQLKELTLNRNGACNSSSQSWSDSEPTRKKGRRATQLKELTLKRNGARNSSQSRLDTQPKRKNGRRATQLKELTVKRSGDEKIPIEFDQSTGNPLGPNRKRFKSFVALLGRSEASILRKDWNDVEDSVKNQIWQSIMLTFDVSDTDFLKKKWISFAGERWRAFKTQLSSRYIYGSLRDKSPCGEYRFLDEETWKRFVESRQDPAFQEKRKKAQQIQAMNCHPHRLSRGGYELLEERIVQEKLKKRQEESQLDPSVAVSPPSPPTRHEKWKRARQRKTGEYTSEDTRIVAEKIDALVEKISQGTFLPVGRQDILTTAIGQPEHPGRVRGVGRGVGIRQYFGPSSRSSPNLTMKELDVIKEQIKEDLRQEMRQVMRQELASLRLPQENANPHPSHSLVHVSSDGSCDAKDVSKKDLHTPEKCELYVEDPLHLVAIGNVYKLGPTIHHKQIEDDKVRVVVKRVRDANARVPIPTEEVQTVGQAPNHFILWPRRLVKLVSDKEIVGSKKDVSPQQLTPQVDPLTRLCIVAMNISKQPIQLSLEPDVIGKPTPIPFFIHQKDILELLMGNDMLCISVLRLWLTYLHRHCISKGIIDMYGFIDPLHIQSTENETDEIQAYIQSRISADRKKCYLAPYFHAAHWQLIIICPRQNVVVFLCSLWKKPTKEFKSIVDLAMGACHVLKGRHSASRKKPTWIFPRAQRQTKSIECGYYVMRHMLNIVLGSIVDSWTEIFKNPDSFSQEEIDDIRMRWANFLLEAANL